MLVVISCSLLNTPFVLGFDPGTTNGLAAVGSPASSAVAFVGSASPLETIERLTAWAGEGAPAASDLQRSYSETTGATRPSGPEKSRNCAT